MCTKLDDVIQASMSEPNFQRAFFGDHCEQLLAIKTKYDPLAGPFVVTEGVESERWDQGLVCRL